MLLNTLAVMKINPLHIEEAAKLLIGGNILTLKELNLSQTLILVIY